MTDKTCVNCGKRRVMRGWSRSTERAQRAELCQQCFATPGVYRKRIEALGLPIRAPDGSRKKS